jgi:hypothetical protein
MAIDLSFFEDENTVVTESYNAGNSGFKDLFEEKFTSFDPDSIISGGNNRLKSGMFAIDIEDSDLAIAYNQPQPATTPARPGRWMNP